MPPTISLSGWASQAFSGATCCSCALLLLLLLLLLPNRQQERSKDDGRMNVRRGQFAFNFGKQQKRLLDVDPQQLREQRKYITDRTKDPKDIARMQKQRQHH